MWWQLPLINTRETNFLASILSQRGWQFPAWGNIHSYLQNTRLGVNKDNSFFLKAAAVFSLPLLYCNLMWAGGGGLILFCRFAHLKHIGALWPSALQRLNLSKLDQRDWGKKINCLTSKHQWMSAASLLFIITNTLDSVSLFHQSWHSQGDGLQEKSRSLGQDRQQGKTLPQGEFVTTST